jgi:carbon storage regulator
MLVLSRKSGEGIRIGETIAIDVLQVRGGRVRLGIQAPNEYRIIRSAAGKPPLPAAEHGHDGSSLQAIAV